MDQIFEKLAAKFDPSDIEWRAGATNNEKTQALALAYITSRAVMNRLDEVVGPADWKDEYTKGPDGGILCGMSIKINGEWVTKWDGAENTNIEGVKGGLSDAFKRAGYKWGIGRYLYDLDGQWVACEQRGKTVVLKTTPKLPTWALPTNGKKKDTLPLADIRKAHWPQDMRSPSYDSAVTTLTSDTNARYVDLEVEDLRNRIKGIDAALKKLTPNDEKRDGYLNKKAIAQACITATPIE